jgi:murein DD-endopeptidase MepM/ murein hydrolase activator NlpD
LRVLRNTWGFRPDRVPDLLGNHVILSSGSVYAALVHLAPGTVEVSPGQQVDAGDVLGRVGHTGNSTSPHLHLQLMDSVDPMRAHGVPFTFRHYEVLAEGRWLGVDEQVPKRSQRIRSSVEVG